jgi:hypothetical protein
MEDMNTSEWLTEAEVLELTGVEQGSAQIRRLESYGIKAFRRPDGRPIVSRWAVRMKAAGLEPQQRVDAGINWQPLVTPSTAPNIDAIREPSR